MVPVTNVLLRNLNATGQNVTAGENHILKFYAINVSGSAAFVQLFDLAAGSVTLGTTIPLISMPVAATAGSAELPFDFPGLHFQIRCSAFATTTADGSTGSASGVFLQAFCA